MSARTGLVFLIAAALGLPALGGCSHVDTARYADGQPAQLPATAYPPPPDRVSLIFPDVSPLTMSSEAEFRLALGDGRRAPQTSVTALGGVRTLDVPLTVEQWTDLDCGWRLRAFLESRVECEARDARADREAGRPLVAEVLGALRAAAAAAGATTVEEVKCYAAESPQRRLWCEGVAGVASLDRENASPQPGATPSVATDDEPAGAPSQPQPALVEPTVVLRPERVVVGGEYTVDVHDRDVSRGELLFARIRPLELDVETAATSGSQMRGLGADLRFSYALSRHLDVDLGAGALWVGPVQRDPTPGTTSAGLLGGVEAHASLRPSLPDLRVDLRAGDLVPVARTEGSAADRLVQGSFLSVGAGLSWPERW